MHSEPSPVPSDANLWPGEQPFTAFGQFGRGKLDLRVFDQDIWWVDITGTPHRLDEMRFDYQSNVIMFLREHADGYHAATVIRSCLQTVSDALGGHDPVTGLDARVIAAQDPLTWLEQTPLLRRLRELTGTSGTHDPDRSPANPSPPQ